MSETKLIEFDKQSSTNRGKIQIKAQNFPKILKFFGFGAFPFLSLESRSNRTRRLRGADMLWSVFFRINRFGELFVFVLEAAKPWSL